MFAEPNAEPDRKTYAALRIGRYRPESEVAGRLAQGVRPFMNRIFTTLTFLFFLFIAYNSQATEPVFCGNEEYGIFIYYNMAERSYKQYVLYHNSKILNKPGYITDILTDFESQTIKLEERSESDGPNFFSLSAKSKQGILAINSSEISVRCDWSAFE